MNQEIETKKDRSHNDNNLSTQKREQLQQDISNLENKPNKTKEEQTLLEKKKKELEELLNRKNNSNDSSSKPGDKTTLYLGLGIIGVFLVLSIFIIARNRKKNKRY